MADKSKGKMSTADAIALVTRKKAHKTGKPKTIKDNSKVKISESVNNSEIISVNNKLEICESQPIDIKNEMTLKELAFIQYHFGLGYGIDKSMILAGYTDITKSARYDAAKKIVNKYESQTEDKRQIFRLIGLGESQVASNIKELAQNAKSEMVRLNANALSAKCLRLCDEPERSHQGVNIIINCQPAGPGACAPGRPTEVIEQEELPTPTKPLQITK